MTTKVKQKTCLQVPAKAYDENDRTKLLGVGYIYYYTDGEQHIQLYDANDNSKILAPGFYYIVPDEKNERLVVQADRYDH